MPLSTLRRSRSLAVRGLIAAALLPLALAPADPAATADFGVARASYKISYGSYPIGQVDALLRLDGDDYTLSINGSTNWVTSVFFYKATASLQSRGVIQGTRILPAEYALGTNENGFQTDVQMSMKAGTIRALQASPELVEVPDRIPIHPGHRRDVVDPASALIVATDRPSTGTITDVCNRTIHVFDGWQRYDVRLAYRGIRTVHGMRSGSYSGDVVVCSARYVPVAGHRPDLPAVKDMAANERIEVWLAPVEGTPLMLPFRISVGIKGGDVVITAGELIVTATERQASVN